MLANGQVLHSPKINVHTVYYGASGLQVSPNNLRSLEKHTVDSNQKIQWLKWCPIHLTVSGSISP